jgi:uncharacterized membrane protein
MLTLHVLTGAIALLSGFLALFARKGGALHRRSGIVFVAAMLTMSATGIAISVVRSIPFSLIVGGLTFYFVLTSVLTVRRPAPGRHWVDTLAIAVGLLVAGLALRFGATGEGAASGMFVFSAVALFAVGLDLRMVIAGGMRSPHHRLARHLWRMCFALLMATTAVFFGQADEFPEPLQRLGLLSVPTFVVVSVSLFWLGRVLLLRRYRLPAKVA